MKPGILVISHGSAEGTWVAQVEAAVGRVRAALGGVPVACGYLELVEGSLIQDGLDRLAEAGVDRILAIPLFVSAGSTHVDEIGWALGAYETPRRPTDLERLRVVGELTYGSPIADDPEIAEALLDKLRAAGVSDDPARESLMLIGHGSEDSWFREEWMRGLHGLAARLAELGGYADADVALLRPDLVAVTAAKLRERYATLAAAAASADADRAAKAAAAASGHRVLAVPAFVSEGYFTSTVIPRRLAGLDCRYAEGSLLPHPKVEAWIERQARVWLDGLSSGLE